MDTAYSLQIYEICGEKATFSFFLKKEEKTRAGKRGTGSAGKRMREEANGRGEKDRKSVPPETEKGTGAERREGKKLDAGMEYQAWNAGSIPACRKTTGTGAFPLGRKKPPEKTKQPQDTGRAWRTPPELRPYRLRGQRSGQLYYSHFLYLKYQMVSAEQKIIRPMAKI